MKADDLIRFRNCAQQGKFGIVSLVPQQSCLAKGNPGLAIYWVVHEEGVQHFTGNQLVLQ